MPCKECSAMDERLQFVARRLADSGTLQGVRHFAQDRLQDLRSLSGMRHAGAHRPEPPSVPLRQPTSFPGGKLYFECEARAPQPGCSKNPRTLEGIACWRVSPSTESQLLPQNSAVDCAGGACLGLHNPGCREDSPSTCRPERMPHLIYLR